MLSCSVVVIVVVVVVVEVIVVIINNNNNLHTHMHTLLPHIHIGTHTHIHTYTHTHIHTYTHTHINNTFPHDKPFHTTHEARWSSWERIVTKALQDEGGGKGAWASDLYV